MVDNSNQPLLANIDSSTRTITLLATDIIQSYTYTITGSLADGATNHIDFTVDFVAPCSSATFDTSSF
jgi:hypothetical protein